MDGYNSVKRDKKRLKHIKIGEDTHLRLIDLKHGNDTFDTVIQMLLAWRKARILSEEDKLLVFGKEETKQ